jgi:Fe-S-cluster containining protein
MKLQPLVTIAKAANNGNEIEPRSGKPATTLEELRQEVANGLLYTHSRANANTSRALENASFLYALIELLKEKGIISIEELEERKATVGKRVESRFIGKGMGVMLQEPEQDKYSFQSEARIDCENRVHLCKAACCRLSFPLSRQDITEGIVKWELGSPYLIAQDERGYCKHMEQSTCRCTIREHRPIPCRAYDCRQDSRIWSDFNNMVVNPQLEAVFRGQATQAFSRDSAAASVPGATESTEESLLVKAKRED